LLATHFIVFVMMMIIMDLVELI